MVKLCETDVLPSCTHNSGQPRNEHAALRSAGPSRCRKLAVSSGLLSWMQVLVVNSCSWSSEGMGSHLFSPSFKCKMIHCTNKSERRNDQAYLRGLQPFTLQRPDGVHQPQNQPPLQSRFALPGANIDLIFRGIQFIFVCIFFPIQGVWLSQRGTGRKGAEEDEGLL